MDGLIVGLITIAIASAIERIFIEHTTSRLRAKEQAFKFHALRDRLQLLVAEGQVEASSLTYAFLMRMLNFSIRNAGAIGLRQTLEFSEKVRKNIGEGQFDVVAKDISKHGAEVQKLAQEFFGTFAWMLVSNDWLVKSGVRAASAVRTSWKFLRPLALAVHKAIGCILNLVAPTKIKAVHEARWYSDQANTLGLCT